MSSLAPTPNFEEINEEEAGPTFQSCPLLLEPSAHFFHNTKHSLQHHRVVKNIAKPISGKTNTKKSVQSSPSSWNIGSIDTLPDAANTCLLEKTRVSLKEQEDVPPDVVGQRILHCLRDLSITILSKKKHKLLAESMDRDIRFYVKLYKEKPENGKYYHVMVELQKRRGCSLSFANVAHTILQATRSNEHSSHKKGDEEENEWALPQHRFNRTMEETDDFYMRVDEEEHDSLFWNIKHTTDLINDKHMDVSLLGMQDLVILTNTDITNYATALRVAKLVLQKENDGHDFNDDAVGLNVLIEKFIFGSPHGIIDNRWKDGFEQWYFERMHYYALTVLANSLQVVWADCLSDGQSAYLQPSIVPEYWLDENNGFLSMLVDELIDTGKLPHNAYQAERCMSVLFQALPTEVSKKVLEIGVSRAIHSVSNNARCCHSLLASKLGIAMEASPDASNRPSIQTEFGAVECI